MTTVYDQPIDLRTIDGREVNLDDYRGKVLLVVNVASRCGFTPQYAGLEALYERYADRGLVILGFPCNQFLFQEPGSADDIAQFCSTKYNVTFPLFEKLTVKGRNQHPLYAELSTASDVAGKAGNVKWNFEKFLINRDGNVVGRFRSSTTPQDAALVAAIESALAEGGSPQTGAQARAVSP